MLHGDGAEVSHSVCDLGEKEDIGEPGFAADRDLLADTQPQDVVKREFCGCQ